RRSARAPKAAASATAARTVHKAAGSSSRGSASVTAAAGFSAAVSQPVPKAAGVSSAPSQTTRCATSADQWFPSFIVVGVATFRARGKGRDAAGSDALEGPLQHGAHGHDVGALRGGRQRGEGGGLQGD